MRSADDVVLMDCSCERGYLFDAHQVGTRRLWSVHRLNAVKMKWVVEPVLLK